MSEIVDHTVICSECNHPNKFKLKADILHLGGGRTLAINRESAAGKICEKCGVFLRCMIR